MNNNFCCPVCTGRSVGLAKPYLSRSTSLTGRSLVCCSNCGTWSIYPIPSSSELNELYEKTSWNEEWMASRKDEILRKGRSQYRFIAKTLIKRPGLRLLDIGAGLGPLYQVIKSELCKRIDYHAVEINPVAIKELRLHGAQVFSTVEEAGGGFDGIILSHILEHVPQPRPFLDDLIKKLNDGGFLFIEVPNEDFRFKTRNEPHVVYYRPSSLGMLVASMGFHVVRVATCGSPVREMKFHAGLSVSPGIRLRFKWMFDNRAPSWLRSIMKWDKNEYEWYGGDRRWIRLLAYKRN